MCAVLFCAQDKYLCETPAEIVIQNKCLLDSEFLLVLYSQHFPNFFYKMRGIGCCVSHHVGR